MIGISLALRQLQRSKSRIAVAGLMLAAILTPILLIWALKTGQVDSMVEAMRSDPANLEIILNKDSTLGPDDLVGMLAAPGMGYMVPTSRSLSVRAFLSGNEASGRQAIALLPSTAGDPLLEGRNPPRIDEIYLSQTLSDSTLSNVGDTALVRTGRENSLQLFEARVQVIGVLPASRLPGARILVHPQLIEEVESYLEGFAIDRLGLTGNVQITQPQPANARIYASELAAVAPLEAALSALGLFARALNPNVTQTMAIEGEVTRLAVIVGWILAAGALLGFWSGLSINLSPQRRHVALLRLMGAGNRQIVGYVTTLGLGIGLFGTALALLVYLAISLVLNSLPSTLPGQLGHVANLPAGHAVIFAMSSMALTLAVSLAFAGRLLAIRPNEVLRDENT